MRTKLQHAACIRNWKIRHAKGIFTMAKNISPKKYRFFLQKVETETIEEIKAQYDRFKKAYTKENPS